MRLTYPAVTASHRTYAEKETKYMNAIRLVTGPLVGAAIGFLTNYVAVRMLFRPYKPIKIGRFTLPFTPGVIPKRKAELGTVLGGAVGQSLVTADDIKAVLLSEGLRSSIAAQLTDAVFQGGPDSTLSSSLSLMAVDGDAVSSRIKAELARRVADGVRDIDIAPVIISEGGRAVKTKASSSLVFRLILTDELILSLIKPFAASLEDYIRKNGGELVMPAIEKEVDSLMGSNPAELLASIGITRESLPPLIDGVYSRFINEKAESVLAHFDIAAIVKEKVDDMDVAEVEALVLSVMKTELNALVNLGGLLGFIIGIINAFV